MLLVAIVTGAKAADFSAPATKKYGDITFLDVAATDANVTVGNDNYLTYGAYYIAQTKKVTTWYNCSDNKPASNKDNGVVGDFSGQGFIKVTATTQDDTNGNASMKLHNSRIRYYYVTGATSVAGLVKDADTDKYTQLQIQEVAADGTLGEATTINGNKSTSQYVINGGDLDASKYYKISFTSNNSSNCFIYQVRFGKAPAGPVDPVFSLSATSIGTDKTAQIKVAGKDDLDGITLSGIAYGTSGVVTVSSAGVVTPVAAGTTTITFSSAAVDGKYNAGSVTSDNPLTITVTAPVVVTPTLTAGGYFFDDSKTVEIACTDADATIKYSYDNSTWNDYTTALTITETTTVYAKAVKTGCEDSEVASATYTKFAPSEIAEVSTATTWDWTSWDQELQLTGTSTPTSTDNYTYADIAVLSGTIAVPASFAGDKIMFKGQYPVRSKKSQAGTWTIKPSVAGTIKVTFSDTGVKVPTEGAAKRYLNINGVNTEYYTQRDGSTADKKTTDEIVVPAGDVVITAYGEDGETWQAIVVEKIVFTPFESQEVTVGETGFATIGLPFATTVPAGVTAYAVQSVNDSKVKMSAAIPAGTTIPANEGFVIVAAPNTYSFAPVASSSYEGTDILEATGINTKAATTDAPIYVLTITDATNKKIGFKKATTGSLGAYKAYLPGTVSNSNSLSVSFDEETAINGIAESEANAEAPVKVIKNGKLFIGNYNVAGQQVK